MMEILAGVNIVLFVAVVAFFIDHEYVRKVQSSSAWIGMGFVSTTIIGVILSVGVILGG